MSNSQSGFFQRHSCETSPTVQMLYKARKRAYSSMSGYEKGEKALICEHYESLQDLIDGTKGNCHLCTVTCEGVERDCWRSDKQIPLWLLPPASEGLSDDQTSKKTIITYILSPSLDIACLRVQIDDGHTHNGESLVRGEELSSIMAIPYTDAQLSTRVVSNAHYHLIQNWLDVCADRVQHPACNTTSEFRRPTRLLGLNYFCKRDGSVDGQDVRLVEGNSSTGQYAALSYCWGTVQQLKLLWMNLQRFHERVPVDELSQVSRDAIAVCRRLSIPFLWVDALCIVQGEDGDFSTEVPRMQDVYAGSTLTIVAADSEQSTEAFLGDRNLLRWLKCTLKGSTESLTCKRYEVYQENLCFRDNTAGFYHIDSRAWFFQERLMSPRSIFLGQKGIHWGC